MVPGAMLKLVAAKIRFLANQMRYRTISGMSKMCELESSLSAYDTSSSSLLEQTSTEAAVKIA
jgi:hypothetical protein